MEVVKAVPAPIPPAWVRRVLTEALNEGVVAARLPRREVGLTVRITGDRELRRLNRRFLGDDHPTDVLSFPSGDLSSGYLGDLALSWPAVVRQAAAFGHAAEVEMALLAVHGLLHLLGWDHATPEEEREMTRLTLACLARSGLCPADGRLSTEGEGIGEVSNS
ncbi:MAG TPA: rRNA maturation RNase YbeY [Candidatus Dormibacteraeota bacterium]|nr:rRNA maturation RNase YbeY [Candidatus Dormibacteraeota bacterium]